MLASLIAILFEKDWRDGLDSGLGLERDTSGEITPLSKMTVQDKRYNKVWKEVSYWTRQNGYYVICEQIEGKNNRE